MPRLLFRYILFDLLRVIGLTTLVLVTVITFGATIKPLAGDKLLNAGQTLRFLGLAIIPMLQYALPFAAGFGATLTLQRMTAENEVQAMAASGIAYRQILKPVLALGLALTLLMLMLTQWVIPRFWSSIERMLATDVTTVLVASIRKHEPFRFRDQMQIYADDIVVQERPEPEGGPDMRMILVNVAAAELDDNKRIKMDVTAGQAVVDVYRRDGRTYLKLAMRDTVVYEAEKGTLGQSQRVTSEPIVIASDYRDNPKALTQGELLELRRHPDRHASIIDAKRLVAESIRDYSARAVIDAELRETGSVELHTQSAQDQQSYVVHAKRLGDEWFGAGRDNPIQVTRLDAGVPTLQFVAREAALIPASGTPLDDRYSFQLQLNQVEVSDLRNPGVPNFKATLAIDGLSAGTETDQNLDSLPLKDLIQRAQAFSENSKLLRSRVTELQSKVAKLHRTITSHLLSRYALAMTALLLIVLGAVLAMVMRGSLPLAIYMWAFMPAIADLIVITAGSQLIRDVGIAGHFVMWSGNALIVLMILASYRRLIRN